MAYKLKPREPLGNGVRRVAAEQIDRALSELDAGGGRDEVVHALRKRCKKLRALLRLVRDGLATRYASENRALRDLSRSLASFRDGTVLLGTHDGLIGHFGAVLDRDALGGVRRQLARAQPGPGDAAAHDVAQRLEDLRAGLAAVRERVPGWLIEGDPHRVLRSGLRRTYKRARRAYRRAAATGAADDFHEWRKRAKYHWYHARLAEPLLEESVKSRARAAQKLTDVLGDAHDLAVYERMLDAVAASCNATAIETLRALAVWRRERLEAQAVDLAEPLFAAKPKAFTASLEAPAEAEALRESA